MADARFRWALINLSAALLATTVGCSSATSGGRGGIQSYGPNNGGDGDGQGTDEIGDEQGKGGMGKAGPNDFISCNDCIEDLAGEGGDAFDPDEHGDNVGVDEEGALVLRLTPGASSKYIWISNTPEGTVSKINVETYEEEARIMVATDEDMPGGGKWGWDPSRTSVGIHGDAFSASRNGSMVSRLSVLGEDCPDTNGDGVITTSTDANYLPHGQDDCLLWQTKLNGDIRGVAAQDFPGETRIEEVVDGPPKIITEPGESYVWAGSNNRGASSELWKLDAETGDILLHTIPPVHVYGLALGGNGLLYMTGGYLSGDMGWIDTAQCVDDASCMGPPCLVTCQPGNCPDTCDGEMKVRLNIAPGMARWYGITVDCKQRVWTGGHADGVVRRFDPSQDAANRLVEVPGSAKTTGIAADSNGFIWAAHRNMNVMRIDAETFDLTMIPAKAHGVAVDSLGHIWGIPGASNDPPSVIDPGPGLMDGKVIHQQHGLVRPYTYSDMTGEQLRLATNAPGSYTKLFEGCSGPRGPTKWHELVFDVETPEDTVVVFRARSANGPKALKKASWVDVASLPGAESPVNIGPYLADEEHDLVEVEAYMVAPKPELTGDVCEGTLTKESTPRIKSFGLRHECLGVN